MKDPVIIETGHTFDREEIAKWFRGCTENGRTPCCPVTQKELSTTDLNPCIALKDAIEEWIDRKEISQLQRASKLLAEKSTTKEDALWALGFIVHLCKRNKMNKNLVRKEGIIPVIAGLLSSSSSGTVRSKALESLQILVEENDQNKEAVAAGDTTRTVVKLIDRGYPQLRELAVALLCELSKCELVCEKIGEVNGAILILLKVADGKSESFATIENAMRTLENLEKCEKNIMLMAENGRLEPLFNLLLEGSHEKQLFAAEYLEKVALSNDLKAFVAQRVGYPLVAIVEKGNIQAKEAAFKALIHISSSKESSKVIIEAGILPLLLTGLSSDGTNCLPTRLKEAAATVLANIVTSGINLGTIPLDYYRTLVSENVVHSLLLLISNTSPAMQCELLEVLAALSSSSATVSSIAASVKTSGAITSLVQFVDTDHQDIRLASIKLLHNVSLYMDRELAHIFCGSPMQLICLLRVILLSDGNTDERAAAIGLLANLPKRDSRLTRQLMEQGFFKFVAEHVVSICRGDIHSDLYEKVLFGSLVKILSRLTYALRDEPKCIALAREYNLASIFTGLLQINRFDEILVVSAKALQNLSKESKYLAGASTSPESGNKSIFTFFNKPQPVIELCRVHHRVCSVRENFCLLKGKAVERLIVRLDHRNNRVVNAALGALCTLLEDGVDIAEGVLVLCRANGIEPIFAILKNSTETLQQRAVWAVERILRLEEIAKEVSRDTSIGSALVHAFQSGDLTTRPIAELALKHINRLPNFSEVFQRDPSRQGLSRASTEHHYKFN